MAKGQTQQDENNKVSIDDIGTESLPEIVPRSDELIQEEEDFYRHKEELGSFLKLMISNFSSNIKARQDYASKIFALLVGWLLVMVAIILLDGFGCIELAESTLNILITTTTVDVLGLFFIVVRYLFGDNDKVKEFLSFINGKSENNE